MKKDMSEKQSLCCSMIVKNAEETIERAIRSVIPVCKQIVVVDTGSFDATTSIASKLGAEVHFFKWTNNFAEARNYSLKFPRTQWVIVLDADEELITETLGNSLNLLDNKSIGGIRTIIRNYLSTLNTESEHKNPENLSIVEHKYTRIFRIRNSDGSKLAVEFSGKIHEQISESIISCGYDIIDSDVIINHYGYLDKNPEKINRNIDLINSVLENNPDDIWLLFHLAETVFGSGKLNEAGEIFFKLYNFYNEDKFKNLYPIEHYEMVRLRLAQIEIQNNNFQKVEEFLNFESKDFNRDGFKFYLLAVAHLLSGKYEKAKTLIREKSLLNSNMLTQKQINDLITAINKIENISK